jgi:ADP-heptose:LPS heptosyltransferase
VCFTGAPDDFYEIEKIRFLMNHGAVNLAGKTSLKTLAALYKKAELLLTTDTGPMHIAAAIKTPVVALFGPTAPWRTGPYGDGHQVIQVDMECIPCFKRTCDTCACMEQITAQMVINRLEKMLLLD